MAVLIRRNIYSLDLNGPEIASLRQGVQAMINLSRNNPADPRGWFYQAGIHGSLSETPLPDWNQCQHGSFFFLSWHRMYVFWFERILRAASGDPNLAVPYWDYTNPNQQALPTAFWQPADASNPLYVHARDFRMNQGYLLPPADVSYAAAFGYDNFSPLPGSSLSFGGQAVAQPGHSDSPHGGLESQPHDLIHVDVGGYYRDNNGQWHSGWMSNPDTAAIDPIFWLHHSNIDRLWGKWLAQGGRRSNPTDQVWMTTQFTFFDENGQPQQMSANDILDTVNQLGYDYESDQANQ